LVGKTRSGCTCHNVTESLDVLPIIEGLPGSYEPGRVYRLSLAFEGGPASPGDALAGFDMSASGGTLMLSQVPDGVRIDPDTGEATHTSDGNGQERWQVRWRAPEEGTGPVTVTLVVNVVNGDGVQGPQDQWGRTEVEVEEGGQGGIRDAPLFWSVVGIAAVIAIIAVAYMAMRGPRLELRR
jgi:hypothetical protein